MNTRFVVLSGALLIAIASGATAGTATYDFIQTSNNDTVGAVLVFATPPASPNAAWSTSDSSAVLSFQITDNFDLGPGFYPASIATTVSSSTGARLELGVDRRLSGGVLRRHVDQFGPGPKPHCRLVRGTRGNQFRQLGSRRKHRPGTVCPVPVYDRCRHLYRGMGTSQAQAGPSVSDTWALSCSPAPHDSDRFDNAPPSARFPPLPTFRPLRPADSRIWPRRFAYLIELRRLHREPSSPVLAAARSALPTRRCRAAASACCSRPPSSHGLGRGRAGCKTVDDLNASPGQTFDSGATIADTRKENEQIVGAIVTIGWAGCLIGCRRSATIGNGGRPEHHGASSSDMARLSMTAARDHSVCRCRHEGRLVYQRSSADYLRNLRQRTPLPGRIIQQVLHEGCDTHRAVSGLKKAWSPPNSNRTNDL